MDEKQSDQADTPVAHSADGAHIELQNDRTIHRFVNNSAGDSVLSQKAVEWFSALVRIAAPSADCPSIQLTLPVLVPK